MQTKSKIVETIGPMVDAEIGYAREMSNAIYGYSEPSLGEFKSSKVIVDYLLSHDFNIIYPFPQLPTAFRAIRGSGGPAIGMLGEYDALPNCGLRDGEWGHGCGHDILGVAPAVGAVAAADYLDKSRKPGRIVYYGCPAEEALVGKVYMARDGAFRDLDACLTWHPLDITAVQRVGGSAMDSLVYEFFGKPSHAAQTPEKGRSALDAAMLFDVAANYLREHIPENVRFHGVIRHGGDAPNIVPAYSKLWYYIRGKDRAQVDEVRARLKDCARGAAIATGTRFKETYLTGIYNRLRNEALHDILSENLHAFGPPKATDEDRRMARKLAKEFGIGTAFASEISPDITEPNRASTDDTNVSWLTPMATFWMACRTLGTPLHHRMFTAQAALPFSMNAAMQAAKAFAGTAVACCLDAKRLSKVKKEFAERSKGFVFDPLVPKGQKVPKGIV